MFIKGKKIYLRAIEPTDIHYLYLWENNTDIWKVSNTQSPWSKFVLEQYLVTAQEDIYTTKQLRLVVCTIEGDPVGCIDLFDFDPFHLRAGIGVMIEKAAEGNGFAGEAIELLCRYAFQHLHLKQIYCNVSASNKKSIFLFKKNKFILCGTKKKWIKTAINRFEDELMFQKFSK
jgi:diamine N-acetyltransferase